MEQKHILKQKVKKWIKKLDKIYSENQQKDTSYCLDCRRIITNNPPDYEYENHEKTHHIIELQDIKGIQEFISYIFGMDKVRLK